MKRIAVAAAVILDPAAENILISRRPPDKHQGDLWEFPGGKIEPGESPEQALCRELFEELGIQPVRLTPLLQLNHDYSDKQVSLDVWTVHEFTGEASGREGQQVKWVSRTDLPGYDFPAANREILEALVNDSSG